MPAFPYSLLPKGTKLENEVECKSFYKTTLLILHSADFPLFRLLTSDFLG